jgi:hypothetical protein
MIVSSRCSPGSPRPSEMFRALGSFPSTNHDHGSSPAHDHASRTRWFSTHDHVFSPNTSHEHGSLYFACQRRASSLECAANFNCRQLLIRATADQAQWVSHFPLSFCLYPLERVAVTGGGAKRITNNRFPLYPLSFCLYPFKVRPGHGSLPSFASSFDHSSLS